MDTKRAFDNPTKIIQHLYESLSLYNQFKNKEEFGFDALDIIFYRYAHILFKPVYLPIVEEYLALPIKKHGYRLTTNIEPFEWDTPD